MSFVDSLKKGLFGGEDDYDDQYIDDGPQMVNNNSGLGVGMDDAEEEPVEGAQKKNKVVNIHATTQLKVVLVKPERFEKFWAYYPRHEDRVSAVREWDRLKPGDELIDAIARALLWQTKEPDWPVPYACRYLRNQRWTDEPPRPRAQGRPAAQQMTGWHMAIVDGEEVLVPDESG